MGSLVSHTWLLALLCVAQLTCNFGNAQYFMDDEELASGSGSGYSSDFQSPTPTSSITPSTTLSSFTMPQATPTMSTPTPYAIFANRDKIFRVNLDRTDFRAIANRSSILNNTIAVDYDIRRNYLFWSDVSVRKIIRANLDGSQPEVIVNNGLSVADGLAWDWLNEKLYWTDTLHREIEVLDVNTGYRRQLIHTGSESKPRGIVLDPNSRYMYWTDWGSTPRIERASLDGSNRETLHSTDLGWPNDITIDYQTQTLYWVDAKLDKIESSFADGSGRHVVTTDLIVHPFSITFHDGVLYWTDWALKQVIFAPTVMPETFRVLVSSLDRKPMAVKVVTLDAQPINSPKWCSNDNGGCSHICLPSAFRDAGFSCLCPVGMELDENGTTCHNETELPTPTTEQGSCIAAGYQSCCVDGACLGSPASCSCHVSCTESDNCCHDIDQLLCNNDTVSTTAPPTTAPPTTAPPTTAPPTTAPPTTVFTTFEPPHGSCIESGYTECCVITDEVDCEADSGVCFCDPSCEFYEDCCTDYYDLCKSDASTTTTTTMSFDVSTTILATSALPTVTSALPTVVTTENSIVPTSAHRLAQTPSVSMEAEIHTSQPWLQTEVMSTVLATPSYSGPTSNSATISGVVMATHTAEQSMLFTGTVKPTSTHVASSASVTDQISPTESGISNTFSHSISVTTVNAVMSAHMDWSVTESVESTPIPTPSASVGAPVSSTEGLVQSSPTVPKTGTNGKASSSSTTSTGEVSNIEASSLSRFTDVSSSALDGIAVASSEVLVQSSPTSSGPSDAHLQANFLAETVVGAVIFVVVVTASIIIIVVFIFVMIRKKRTAAIVMYEIFENQSTSSVNSNGMVDLSRKPSFMESTDSGVDFKIDSEV